MPGIAPLALAAVPLPPSKSSATELADPLLDLIQGLCSKKINVVSYSADRTEIK